MNAFLARLVLFLAAAWLFTLDLAAAQMMDLAGPWQVQLDPEDKGVASRWAEDVLPAGQPINLPNTTDLAGLGFALDTNTMRHAAPFPVTTRFPAVKEPYRADEHGYLVRRHLFVGPAWYRREIEIPQAWAGQLVTLRIERALWKTEVWVDGQPAGSHDSLAAEHRHELGILEPGRHLLTVRVDNRMIHNISTVSHAYGPETQSRWNGMIGALTLEAAGKISIRSMAAFPAADRRSVRVVLNICNASTEPGRVQTTVRLLAEHAPDKLGETSAELVCAAGTTTQEITLQLRESAEAWDEFHPVRYRLQATLSDGVEPHESKSVLFGFRHVERVGKAIKLNGRKLFLRGTLDCAVYPKTGHPPMNIPEWERVMSTIKEYGFNHVRFHTWCPPEAAFEAADRIGLYLQPETAAWVDDWGTQTVTRPSGIGRDPEVTAFLQSELRRMSEAYGNHPSFLLCAIGNEFGNGSTDWDRIDAMVGEIKNLDPRRLYTGCGARKHLAADDYWFTHHTGASTRGVGPGHTEWDFAEAMETSPVPVIAHETGQRPVFPDYDSLLPKFTGPLLPLNLERYQRTLFQNGLGQQMQQFVRASARFQLTQYKAEHEAMLRTRGYAGYQLLMLNDFTGQSEALVGILDPFWESKGVVSAAEVRQWNAPTVILARFPKYVWTADERFAAKLEVAHFGPASLPSQRVEWAIVDRDGAQIVKGAENVGEIPTGGVTELGSLAMPLREVRSPVFLTFSVRLGTVTNHWPLWIYPAEPSEPDPGSVRVTRTFDEAAIATLKQNGKVLLLAHGVKNAFTARSRFESVYWSAGWWGNKFSSLGLVCDPRHPLLREFPNEGVSDWQWRDLCAGGKVFDLTGAPAGFGPIIQAVPDFHYNSLLGHVFEARVGGGSLLVCGYNIEDRLEERPAARQFRRSLFRYVAGEDFSPSIEVPLGWVEARCRTAGLAGRGASIGHVSSEDTANGNVAANILDGDPASFWHSRWQPRTDGLPQEIVIDLGREVSLRGLRMTPRQDQSNGRIALAKLFAAKRANEWAEATEVRGIDSAEAVAVQFREKTQARYLRVVVEREVKDQPFAALAELELME